MSCASWASHRNWWTELNVIRWACNEYVELKRWRTQSKYFTRPFACSVVQQLFFPVWGLFSFSISNLPTLCFSISFPLTYTTSAHRTHAHTVLVTSNPRGAFTALPAIRPFYPSVTVCVSTLLCLCVHSYIWCSVRNGGIIQARYRRLLGYCQ